MGRMDGGWFRRSRRAGGVHLRLVIYLFYNGSEDLKPLTRYVEIECIPSKGGRGGNNHLVGRNLFKRYVNRPVFIARGAIELNAPVR